MWLQAPVSRILWELQEPYDFRLTGLCDRNQLEIISNAQSSVQANCFCIPVHRMTLILSRALPSQEAAFADGASSR
jgi:hypothetical protein